MGGYIRPVADPPKEVIEQALKYISTGSSQSDARLLLGINWSVWHGWIKAGREEDSEMTYPNANYLVQNLPVAENSFKRKMISTIVEATEVDWKAASWLLTKKFPTEFAEKSQVTQTIVTENPFDKMSKEELQEALDKIAVDGDGTSEW